MDEGVTGDRGRLLCFALPILLASALSDDLGPCISRGPMSRCCRHIKPLACAPLLVLVGHCATRARGASRIVCDGECA